MRIKTLAILTLLIAVGSAASAQEPTLQVSADAAKSEMILELGPVDIPAGDHASIDQPKTQGVIVPVNGFLHGFTVEMVDHDGNIVPSVVLHHINIIAPQRRELFSPIMQRVGAAGAETGPLHLPRLIGYPVERGDSLIVTAMFHNPTADSYSHVHLRVRFKYSSSGSLRPTIAIQPFYMDVMPPAGYHAYTLPPGKSQKSWEASPAVPGRVIGLGGHLHKYGTSLRLEDLTAGKILWEAKPMLDSIGDIVGMPRKFFWKSLGLQLHPSHVYRVTAEYDNPTGEPIEEGAMGTLGGIFAPDERYPWPSVDRANPDYVADVKVTYARNSGEMPAMHHHHD